MAQSKSSPGGKSGKPAGGNRPGGKPAGKSANRSGATSSSRPAAKSAAKTTAKSATGRSAAAKDAAAKAAATTKGGGGRPPNRKKPKSIVNQRQTPWGLIATTAAIVIFAVAIVAVVIATRPDDSGTDGDSATKGGQTVKSDDRYRQPEFPAAAAIKGVTYRVQAQHTHVGGTISYDTTPPTGGNHAAYWADCTGTVYDKAIANENAVHMLEHGAIWITYNANEIKGAQLAKLKTYVSGVDRLALSPYPSLSSPISLQAWGYQLKVTSPDDPRIAQFIKVLKFNQKTTPEPNATCSQPTFKESPSTFGDPLEGPRQ